MTTIEQAAQALKLAREALCWMGEGGSRNDLVKHAESAVDAALASLEAAKQEPGWKLVPVEPTPEMLRAAIGDGWVEPYTAPRESGVPTECDISKEDADWINAECSKEKAAEYRAVLAAAPSPGSGT